MRLWPPWRLVQGACPSGRRSPPRFPLPCRTRRPSAAARRLPTRQRPVVGRPRWRRRRRRCFDRLLTRTLTLPGPSPSPSPSPDSHSKPYPNQALWLNGAQLFACLKARSTSVAYSCDYTGATGCYGYTTALYDAMAMSLAMLSTAMPTDSLLAPRLCGRMPARRCGGATTTKPSLDGGTS